MLQAIDLPPVEDLIQPCKHEVFQNAGLTCHLLRLDLIHPHIGSNKYFKLKLNIEQALNEGHSQLITFGGVHSNHLRATAFACKLAGIQSIGMVRGEELPESTTTLQFARQQGMQLHFISRENYRMKEDATFIKQLLQQYGKAFVVPEGGSNLLGVRGAMEIPKMVNQHFDFWAVGVGTAGTLAGIAAGLANSPDKIIGFSSLKGEDTLSHQVRQWHLELGITNNNWIIDNQYHFGGYAKNPPQLQQFINDFALQTGLRLDHVYNAKMMYGLMDYVAKGIIPKGSSALAVITATN